MHGAEETPLSVGKQVLADRGSGGIICNDTVSVSHSLKFTSTVTG